MTTQFAELLKDACEIYRLELRKMLHPIAYFVRVAGFGALGVTWLSLPAW